MREIRDLEEAVDLCSFSSNKAGTLAWLALCLHYWMGSRWDSILLALSLYISASAVNVFMNSNSEPVLSVSLFNALNFAKLSQ